VRTTLEIDDDILAVARSLARAQGVSIGHTISGLARKGLSSSATGGLVYEDDFPVFVLSAEAQVLTPEMVKDADTY